MKQRNGLPQSVGILRALEYLAQPLYTGEHLVYY